MKLECYGCSCKGPVRSQNEDAVLARECGDAGLFLVADGIGGHAHGEAVSGLIRDRYDQWWRDQFLPAHSTWTFPEAADRIKEELLSLNRDVIRQFGEKTAGSTIALLFLFRGKSLCLSAGDSRIYRIRWFRCQQLTRDDVYGGQELSEAGRRSSRTGKPSGTGSGSGFAQRRSGSGDEAGGTGQAARFRKQDVGKLMGAVGIRATLEFSLRTDAIRPFDQWFLCSDGVYRYIRPWGLWQDLALLGGLRPPAQTAGKIAAVVEQNGAKDNYSMIIVRQR